MVHLLGSSKKKSKESKSKKSEKSIKITKSFVASVATSFFSLAAIIYYAITFSASEIFFVLALLALVSFLFFGYFAMKEKE